MLNKKIISLPIFLLVLFIFDQIPHAVGGATPVEKIAKPGYYYIPKGHAISFGCTNTKNAVAKLRHNFTGTLVEGLEVNVKGTADALYQVPNDEAFAEANKKAGQVAKADHIKNAPKAASDVFVQAANNVTLYFEVLKAKCADTGTEPDTFIFFEVNGVGKKWMNSLMTCAFVIMIAFFANYILH